VALADRFLTFTHSVAKLHLQAVAPGLVAAVAVACCIVVCSPLTTVALQGMLMGTKGVSGAGFGLNVC